MQQLLDEVAKFEPVSPAKVPARVLFLVDGLDEIARLDSSFPEIPFLLARPNVVWVCAGRPEGQLQQVFAPQRSQHIFPDGLPPMASDDIRGLLLDDTGQLKYDLLKLDVETTSPLSSPSEGRNIGGVDVQTTASSLRGKVSSTVNAAVAAVVQRAAGLPLYVHFVVQDILSGHFRFAELPERLPPSLNAYYDDLLRRLSIGQLQALLTPLVVTLAWAQAPLDEPTRGVLLAGWLQAAVPLGLGSKTCTTRWTGAWAPPPRR